MDVAEKLEETLGDDVTVERDGSDARRDDGSVRFTVRCDPADGARVRELLAELEGDVTFETTR